MDLLNVAFLGDNSLMETLLSDITEYGHHVTALDHATSPQSIPARQLNVIVTTANRKSELIMLGSHTENIIVIASNQEIITDSDTLLRQERLSIYLIHNGHGNYLCGEVKKRDKDIQNNDNLSQLKECINDTIIALSRGVLPEEIRKSDRLAYKFYANTPGDNGRYHQIGALIPVLLERLGDQTNGCCATDFCFINWDKNAYFYTAADAPTTEERQDVCHFFYNETGALRQNCYTQAHAVISLAQCNGGVTVTVTGDDARFRRFTDYLDALVLTQSDPFLAPLVISDSEIQQLALFNNTHEDEMWAQDVIAAFRHIAGKNQQLAACYADGHSYTYGELDKQSDQMACWLLKHGDKRNDIVAISMQKSALLLIILLGVLKSDKTYVLMDPLAPIARNQSILDDVQPGIILADTPLQAGDAPCIHPGKIDFSLMVTNPNSLPQSQSKLAYICYTSGTTGKPKGVMITREALSNIAENHRTFMCLEKGSKVLSIASPGFDAFGWDLYGALISGAILYIAPSALHAAVDALHRYLVTHAIGHITITPAVLELLPRESWNGLRSIIVMGDAPTPEVVAYWAGQTRLCNGYGPTEATIATSLCEYQRSTVWNCIGKPLRNYRCHILDAHHNVVPIGFEGELCIAGVGLARGYLHQPQLTDEKFVHINPYGVAGEERVYKTGDIAKWDDHGNIIFIGRKDHQIKVRGVRIEIGEVEAAIHANPEVARVCVVAKSSSTGKVLVAFVQPVSHLLTATDIRCALATLLHPAAIPTIFVFLPSMPLTINGKVDRKLLEKWEIAQGDNEAATPETEIEIILERIVAEAIGCLSADVTEDFINLGAHSLTMSKIVSLVARDLCCRLNIADLFHYNTIRKLADYIESNAIPAEKKITVSAERRAALSPQQNLLWYLSALNPDDCSYNLPTAIEIRGDLDLSLFGQALNFIYEKHESLRTQFGEIQGAAIQYAIPYAPLTLEEHLFDNPQEPLGDIVKRLCAQPFDISQQPPVIMRLIRYHEHHHVLIFIKHNIITDAWSENLILSDLWQCYNNLCEGKLPTSPLTHVQTIDIVNSVSNIINEDDRAYWKEQIHGSRELYFPLDYPRPLTMTHAGGHIRYQIGSITAGSLAARAKELATTQFVLLMASLKYLLSKYANQEEIVIGTAIAARDSPYLGNVSGFYVNTVPLRTQIGEHDTLASFVSRVAETCVGAYRHQSLSFDRILREIDYERVSNKNPLFQIMAILQNAGEVCQAAQHDCALEKLNVSSGYSMFDMTWNFSITAEKISIELDYSSELFHVDTMWMLLGNYEKVLQSLLTNAPTSALAYVDYLSNEEKQRILQLGINGNRSERGTLMEQIRTISESQPNLLAVSCKNDSYSYGQMWALSDRIASYLTSLDHRPYSVGIMMEKGCKVAALILGILKAGKYYIPIDLNYPADRVSYMIENSQARVLVTDSSGSAEQIDLPATAYKELVDAAPAAGNVPLNIHGNSLAYIMYTSGSTGNPKGVMITHDNLNNFTNCFADQLALSHRDKMLSLTSISFDIFGLELFCSLISGTPVILCPREISMDPVKLFSFIEKTQPTVIQATPTVWGTIASHLPTANDKPLTILCGGEKMPSALLTQLRCSATKVLQVYGPTETTIWSTLADLTLHGSNECIGKPVNMTDAFIMDNNGDPMPVGAYGELYLGGAGVSPGYWNNPQLTGNVFINRQVLGTQRYLYKTGDIVRFNRHGDLEYLGRNDHQVKIRGHRIELGEIDLALSHIGNIVRALSLIHGEGNSASIISYLQLAQGSQLNEKQVRAMLKARLPNIMIPAGFVILPAFPLTNNNKIDIRKLPMPKMHYSSSEEDYVCPTTPEESTMQQIWQAVLAQQNICVTESFFNLGGNSLQIPRLLHDIRQKMQVALTIREFILNSQIRDLTALALTKIKEKEHGIH